MSKTLQSKQAPRFSREWWLESAKSTFWIMIVTVLIWIYADMEFTQSADVTMIIRLNTAGSSPPAVLTSERTHEVTFKLRGNRSDLDRFAKKFRDLEVDFDLSTLPGFHPGPMQAIPSVLVLESVADVGKLGLSVASSSPPTISNINIEKLEPRELPIEFIFKGGELAEAPKATVEVSVAASRWPDIYRLTPKPKIRTVEKDLANLPADENQKVQFQLISTIGAESVELKSDTVTVNLQVVRKTAAASETIPITVRIVTPAEWIETEFWTQYKLVRRDRIEWLTKITVTGSRKDIDILRTDKTKIVDAYIVLTDSDIAPISSWSARKVTLRFPPGLQIQLASGQIEPTVQFRLAKRVAPTQ